MSGSRPRVLFLISRSVRGGAQAYVRELMRGIADDFDPILGAGEEGHLTESVRGLGFQVHVAPELRSPAHPVREMLAVGRVVRLVRESGADLVSAHSTNAGWIGRAAAHRGGVPAVFTAHGWPFAGGIPWPRRRTALSLERWAARRCRRIIVVCDADRRLALDKRVAPEARLVTIRYGVRDVAPRAVPDAPGAPVVAMVARFEPQKDHACLLRALAAVGAAWCAVLVGDGPARPSVEALARRLGVADRVTFLGPRDDVAEVLAKAHVFALATRWEGLPLTILEAMRAGLPVVATDVGGVREAVADGETGFLVPHGDPQRLAGRLAELAADPAMRSRMGAAGRRSYESRFTFERMVAETAAVYRNVLSGAARDGGASV